MFLEWWLNQIKAAGLLIAQPLRRKVELREDIQKQEVLRNIREVVEMTIQNMIEGGEHIPERPEIEVKVSSEPLVAVTV